MEMKNEKLGKFLITMQTDDRSRTIKMVFLDYIPVVHFAIDDLRERKLAAIELIEQRLCNQKMAGKICGFHRNTVLKLVKTKRLLGVAAVLQDGRGHQAPYKYINKTLSHIKKLLRKHPDWTDEAIAKQAMADLKIDVSRSAVARIRTKKKDTPYQKPRSKKELMDLDKLAEIIAIEQSQQRQILLSFHDEPELKEKAEKFSKESAPKAEGEAQLSFIESLQEGKDCAFAGGLMHNLFLQETGFEELMAPFPLNLDAVYQPSDMMATIFHSINQGIESIETLKLVNASELGILIGLNRTPDKVTLRDHLSQMAEENISDSLIDQFARRLLEMERIDREVFFIDGHFLPYYGMSVIAKGYFTVRRIAMKGNELYAITDLQGRPLFFITESNEIDFRPIISRSAAMLISLGITRPILVFDRGGYGIHFFSQLNQEADFVTWAKHISDQSLEKIPNESFVVGLRHGDKKFLIAEERRTVSESIQTAKKDGREVAATMNLRLVVLKDVNTGRRIGIYTNNFSRHAVDIAFYMLQRWGKSENVFKELMASFYLNYHPGYDIKELEKQPLVDNPDVGLTNKAIKALKGEINIIGKDIELIEYKIKERQDKRLTKKKDMLNKTIEEKKHDITQLERTLDTLPDKVSIIELLKGKSMSRCDLEKKKLYDLMQFMAFHSRERLVEIFRDCYNDNRDIKRVLNSITSRPGIVKLVGRTLMVLLKWIENDKQRQAAQKLCHILNQKSIKLRGDLDILLSFHVIRLPGQA